MLNVGAWPIERRQRSHRPLPLPSECLLLDNAIPQEATLSANGLPGLKCSVYWCGTTYQWELMLTLTWEQLRREDRGLKHPH